MTPSCSAHNVILRCALFLRAWKDGRIHRNHPSRLAEDGEHLRMTAAWGL